ncbi:winged helix-turn-helix domain-containing protein [Sulfurimonas sp.]|uniref:winged helix-turn-helix domain-containing protein n=1 Tax=Sulfurimonas sp. TaxID=2022749 RepID=UPI002AB24ECA|nr:winged helix-turn-helix domain-containing protein [Sulfurimonas sp.]
MLQTNYVRYKYTPDEMSEDEFLDRFVVREDVFNDIFEDLKSSDDSNTNQHYIIIGQRGQGKTTLLRKLQIEVKNDDELSKFLLPIKFAEEQYQIRSLCRLWEEVAEYLQTLYEDEFSTILDDMEKHFEDDDYDLQCFSYLESVVKTKGKKLLLLIDNLDELIGKLSEKEQRRLREILISSSIFRIVGGSTKMLEHHHDYSKAFYEYFKIIKLKSLNAKESREFLLSIARDEQKEKIQNVIENSPARIETLRRITGGVPRTLVMLFDIFLDEEGNAFDDLLKILDEATPLYKHRMDDLPSGLQEIVHTIAINWDGMLTSEIAKKTRESSKSVSAQLKKLEKYEIVESESIGKNKIYKIKERFFNIWYLMRFGRKKDRQRVEWLVKFLETWCTQEELEERAVKFISRVKKGGISSSFAFNMAEAYSYLELDMEVGSTLMLETKKYLQNMNSVLSEELSVSDKDVVDKALNFLTKNQIDMGLNILLKSNKNSKYVISLIGSFYMLKGEYKNAEKYLLSGVKKGFVAVQGTLSGLYFLQGINANKSLELLLSNSYIKDDPNNKYQLAIALLWNEKYSDSYEIFINLIKSEIFVTVSNYLRLLISKGQYYQAKKFLEMPEYQLKERYKPIWYALMTLMQDDFPHEIKKMGSELKESVDEVLKEIEVYKKKYAV